MENGDKQGFVPAVYLCKVEPPKAVSDANSSGLNMGSEEGETVAERHQTIKQKYASLKKLANERKHRLEESLKLHEFKREINELHTWISDKVIMVADLRMIGYLEILQANKGWTSWIFFDCLL